MTKQVNWSTTTSRTVWQVKKITSLYCNGAFKIRKKHSSCTWGAYINFADNKIISWVSPPALPSLRHINAVSYHPSRRTTCRQDELTLPLSLSAGSAALLAVETVSNMYGLTPKPSGSSSSLSSLAGSPPQQREGSPCDCFPCLCC